MWRNPPSELERDSYYRGRYFEHDRGLAGSGVYLCPYCGRLLFRKKSIQVDHIHSVYSVQHNRALRGRFLSLPDGVNNIDNLIGCCGRCNRKKASRGGLWIFLAHHRYLAFLLRCLFLIGGMTLYFVLVAAGAPLLPQGEVAGGVGTTVFIGLVLFTLVCYFIGSSRLFRFMFCIVGLYILAGILSATAPELWEVITGIAGAVWDAIKSLGRDIKPVVI